MNESGERVNWRALLNPYFLQVFGICLFGWTLANMDQAFFGYAIPPIKLDFAIGDQEIGYILRHHSWPPLFSSSWPGCSPTATAGG